MSIKKKFALIFLTVSFLMSVSGVFSDLNNLVLKRQSYTSVAEEAYIINQQGLTETDPCPQKMFGDANCDSEIEFNDFWVLKGEYFNSAILKKPAPFNGWNSDFDQNGKVDLNDFSIWKTNCFSWL